MNFEQLYNDKLYNKKFHDKRMHDISDDDLKIIFNGVLAHLDMIDGLIEATTDEAVIAAYNKARELVCDNSLRPLEAEMAYRWRKSLRDTTNAK